MSKTRRVAAVFVVFVLALLITGAEARSIEVELKPASPEVKAWGDATIKRDNFVPYDRLLDIYVFRLKPNSVYTVWLYDKRYEKRIPAGLKEENHFRTDGSGNAHYTATLYKYDIDWNTLEIAYHPDADSGNTGGMSVELTARLYL